MIALGGIGFTAYASGSLSGIFAIENADASCCSTPIDNGRCTFTERCSPDAGGTSNNCDSTKGNCDSVLQPTF